MPEESGSGETPAQASPFDLAHEFARIDGEKERLRLLADQLGLGPAAQRPPRREHPVHAAEAAPERPEVPATPPPALNRAVRRASLPLSSRLLEGGPARPLPRPSAPPIHPPSSTLIEKLTGFVPGALYDEMKRERDELFFRLTKLEMERAQFERVRRSLEVVEAEVRRLEEEVRKRRSADPHSAEPLRLSYRRWLFLRRRRAVRFTDFLACRRASRHPEPGA